MADTSIRWVWCRQGNEEVRQALRGLIDRNLTQSFAGAVEEADALVDLHPWLAEGWNHARSRCIAWAGLPNRFATASRRWN